jgi:ribonucleoside-diphosphate reductase alpha chain
VGLYEDDQPGEVFLKMAKEGSTISGLMDSVAILTSIALQYGVPLKALVDKFSHTRFEPAGFTQNPEIPFAKSVIDYVFRWLGMRFLQETSKEESASEPTETNESGNPSSAADRSGQVVPIRGGSRRDPFMGEEDAPGCWNCGALMMRAGACYVCPVCGESGGCG